MVKKKEDFEVRFVKEMSEAIEVGLMLREKDRTIRRVLNENEELIELLLDVLHQACGEDNEIDNHCLSAYENACSFLEKKGELKNVNGRIYKIMEVDKSGTK